MFCGRCITSLRNELQQHDLIIEDVSLGKVGISFQVEKFNENTLVRVLSNLGFSLGLNKNTKLVEQVKCLIKNYFETLDPLASKKRFSDLISDELNMSYDNISSIFSTYEKNTIENYVILYRINLVKSHIELGHHTLTEIAYITGFSSVFHLSKQFKELTNMTPSEYRMKHLANN